MNKSFLVTISNNTDNLKGVSFICSFFQKQSHHQLTLMHICRLDCQDMNKALMEKWTKPEGDIKGELTIGAQRAIERAKEMIGNSDFSIDKVVTKTVAERFGKVKDILNEGSAGLYDAIILGQRASYTLQWVFERPADELAQSLISDSAFFIPLWICPEVDPEKTNVLVCIDGSESSYRAVDHAGYMLSKQTQHSITLFHVKNSTDGTYVESIFGKSRKILSEHGISDDRIDGVTEWNINITRAILNRAQKGKYAAVAIGLHGQPEGLLKRLNLVGGTTSAIIAKIEGASVWVCP